MNIPNTIPASRASSSPLSSPQSLSSLSSPLPSSPTRTSPPTNNSRDDVAEISLPRLDSNEVATQCTDLQDDSDSDSGNEVGGPPDPRHTIPKSPNGVRSACNNQLAVQPSPAEAPVSERPKDILSWKEGRLRSKPSQAMKAQQDHSAEDHNTTTKTKKGTKRKASTSHEQPAVEGRTSSGPLVALVNQIGRTNTIPDLQETIQELKARPYQTHALAESLHTRTPMQIDYPPARIIQAIPNLTLS